MDFYGEIKFKPGEWRIMAAKYDRKVNTKYALEIRDEK